jgi:Holliday junction resolvase RusA-like endonuclease
VGRRVIEFVVLGKPAAAGSKRSVIVGGRARTIDANPHVPAWKKLVQDACLDALGAEAVLPVHGEAPLVLEVVEYRPRPRSHYTSRGTLNAQGQRYPRPTTAPDILKIARGIADALSGICYRDDSQIVRDVATKVYGEPARVHVIVTPAETPALAETPVAQQTLEVA